MKALLIVLVTALLLIILFWQQLDDVSKKITEYFGFKIRPSPSKKEQIHTLIYRYKITHNVPPELNEVFNQIEESLEE